MRPNKLSDKPPCPLSTIMNKCCLRIQFADLGNLFYALITTTFHLISTLTVYKQIKVLMLGLMLDLSSSITQKLSAKRTGDFYDLDRLKQSLFDSKFFITNQFSMSITCLVFSTVFMFGFVMCSLFKTGNLANDNIQLGSDLVMIDCNRFKKPPVSSNSNYSPKSESTLLNFSLSSSSPETPRSSVYSSSTSFNSSQSSVACRLSLASRTLARIFMVPPLNATFHLIMCLFIFLAKLDLAKFQLSYDIDRTVTGEQILNTTNEFLKDNMFQKLQSIDLMFTSFTTPYEVDLNYVNFCIAFFMLSFKLTRVYSSMNRLYALIILIHMVLFTLLNLTTHSAFETLFKNNALTNLSTHIVESELKSLIYSMQNINEVHEKIATNARLSRSSSILLSNESLLLAAYTTSWCLNVFYLTSLNLFGFSVFRQAQIKIKQRYEQFLTRFKSTNNINMKSSCQRSRPELQIEYSPVSSKIGVKNQYKAILIGIMLMLVTEVVRLPLIYAFYSKYFQKNSRHIYLVALVMQLVYLVFNALFWILLSFRTNWTVRFTANFRVLFWNRMFTEYFHDYNLKKMSPSREMSGPTDMHHRRSRSVDNYFNRFYYPKPSKKNPKLFIKNRRSQTDTLNVSQALAENYFFAEISQLPHYHSTQGSLLNYDRKFVDFSIESMLKARNQDHLNKIYSDVTDLKSYKEPKKSSIYVPHDQNFNDNNLSENSDMNTEMTSDEFEIKVKLNNNLTPQTTSMSSFNKNNTVSYACTKPESIDSADSGRESWQATQRNKVCFDKHKLFSAMLNEAKSQGRHSSFDSINI